MGEGEEGHVESEVRMRRDEELGQGEGRGGNEEEDDDESLTYHTIADSISRIPFATNRARALLSCLGQAACPPPQTTREFSLGRLVG